MARYECNTCGAEFNLYEEDAEYCPICSDDDIEEVEE